MKKITTLLTILTFTFNSYAQSTELGTGTIIDSVVINPITCNGGTTSLTIYTNASNTPNNVSYDFYIVNAGIYMQYPGYPVVSNNSLVISSLTAGLKRIIVEYPLNSGNFDTLDFAVTQPDNIISFNNSTNVSCFAGNDGTIDITTYLGTAGYFYTLNGGTPQYSSSNYTFNNLTAGTYSVDITDTLGCAYSQNPVIINITQPQTPLTASTSSSNFNGFGVSCYNGNNGSITITASGGTPNYNYSWSNGSSSNIISNIGAGTYSCTVSDDNGCTLPSIPITINEPSEIVDLMISSNVNCNGDNNGTASISLLGGIPPYTYLWSNGQTTQSINNLTADSYSCTFTDFNNCTQTSSISIIEPPTPLVLTLSSDSLTCYGGSDGSATVHASGGLPPYTYLWSNSSTDSIYSGLSAGLYSVTVTDAFNCSVTQSVDVFQPDNLIVPIISQNVSCNSESDGLATAIPSGGTAPYSYIWLNSGYTTPTNTNLSAGSYTVSVTDAANCAPISSTVIIYEPATITSIANINDVSCFGGNDGQINLSVSGGNGVFSYLWSDGQTTQNASGLSPTSYYVVITDSSNCSDTFNYQVTAPTTLYEVSSTVEDASCFGSSDGQITVLPVGGTPPYNYSWPNGQNSQVLTNVSSGSYLCTITDANGCNIYSTTSVGEPSQLILSSTSTSASCFGYNDGAALVIPQGGTSPYTYNWTNGQTTQEINNLVAGTYSVMVFDVNNCPAPASIIIGEPIQISASLSNVDVLCNGDSTGSVVINNIVGVPPYSYFWSNNGFTGTINQNLHADTYFVTITDGNGCNNTLSSTLLEPDPITANISFTDISVNGASDGTISAVISGGTNSFTYNWSGPNNYVNTNATINSLDAGLYTLTVTDGNGCITIFNQVINEPACNISIQEYLIQPLCFGDVASISWQNTNGLAPYSNTLIDSDGNILVNAAQYNAPNTPLQLPDGVYDLIVFDASNCSGIWNIQVDAPDSIEIDLTLTDVICNGNNDGTAAINTVSGGSGVYTYDWGVSTNPNILFAGNYNVQVTDNNGCSSDIINYTINEPAALTIDSIPTTLISCTPGFDGTASVFASGGILPYAYSWSNGQSAQTAQNLSLGSYSVTITDANNCSSSASNIQILNAPPLNINVQQTLITCSNQNDGALFVDVISGSSPITYSWIDLSANTVISTDSFASNLQHGAYSVLATDVNGCINQASILLSNPLNISFSLNANDLTINNAGNGSINAFSITGGLAPYSYFWTGPNGFTSTAQNINSLAAGTYNLSITDANGCSSSQSALLNEPACNVVINETVTQPLCDGNNGTISWNNSGGGGVYSNFLTNINTNFVLVNQTSIGGAQTLPEGSYTLQVFDQYGCGDLLNIQIIEPEPLIANVLTNDVTCFNGNDGSVIINPLGGSPPYSFNYGGININALSAGTYNVILTDNNQCSSIPQVISFNINEPLDLLTSISSTDVSCIGASDGSATVSIANGTAPFTFSWSPSGLNSQTVNSLPADTHYVLVTDAFGCTSSFGQDFVIITEPALALNATFNYNDITCFGLADGMSSISVTGGTAPYTYLWSNGGTNPQISNLTPGNYICTVTDANGCIGVFSQTISQPTEIIANVNTVNTSCYGYSDGSAVVTASGGSGSYNYLWFNNTSNSNVLGLQSGSYNVIVSDNTGCDANQGQPIFFNINDPDSIILTTSILNDPTCFGGADGVAIVNVQGGNPAYTYNWIDSNSNIISTNSQAQNLFEGIFDVVVTDFNNCSDTTTVTLVAPDAIAANITFVAPTCNGFSDGSATVNPTGGTAPYSYLWSSNATTATNYNLNASTNYFVSISDSNGCVLSGYPVNITEPSSINVSYILSDYNGFNVSCFDSSNAIVSASASGGNYPYYFSTDGVYYSSDSVFINITEGWFVHYVRDENSCVSIDSVQIVGPPIIEPNLTIINDISCFNGNDGTIASIPQGGIGNYSYFWSNFTIADNITTLNSGNYNVEVTDGNGCIVNESIFLAEPNEISNTISSNPASCGGSADGSAYISSTGGTPPYTYLWNNGSVTDSIIGLTAGMYTCTVSDSNGCIKVDSIEVVESSFGLAVSCTSLDVDCYGNASGSAIAYATGGSGTYSYQWNDPNSQTSQQAFSLIAGTYIITIIDSFLCSVSDTVVINEPQPLSLTTTLNNITCFAASDGSLGSVVSGGVSTYSYYWQGPNFFTSNSDTINNLEPGEYILTVIDDNNCKISDTSLVIEPEIFTAVLSTENPNCYNSTDGQIDVLVGGGISPYSASFVAGLISYPTTDSIIISGINSISDTLYLNDANGCSNNVYVNLLNPLELLVEAVNTTEPSCFGYLNGTVSIDVIGGTNPLSFQLTDNLNNIISTQSSYSNLSVGDYQYIITDNNNCSVTSIITIEEPEQIEIFQNASCYGTLDIEVYNANGIYQIFWSGNFDDTTFINNLSVGQYDVTVIDEIGCTVVDSFDVNAFCSYSISESSCTEVNDGSIEINNIQLNGAPYSLFFDGELISEDIFDSYTIENLLPKEYLLTFVDVNGCTFSEVLLVDYIGGYNCISVPVVISPNNDGTNDLWHPINDLSTEIEVSVLNRWGQSEYYYKGNSMNFEWNGINSDGNELPSNDYYYIIQFRDKEYSDLTGVITLIR